jgi:nitrogen fixation/metabolism regulation signal transduction histidine kinase
MIVMLRGEAAEHGISVRTELATDAPRVASDRVQLQQVMMNLILNGIDSMKRSQAPASSSSRSRPTDEGVVVEVSDTGPGIAGQTRRRDLQPVLHDQGPGHPAWGSPSPLDRRVAWRQAVGRGQPPARRTLPRQSSRDSGDE